MESHVSAGGLGIGLGHLPRLPRLAAAMLAIGGHECIYHLDFVRIPGGGGADSVANAMAGCLTDGLRRGIQASLSREDEVKGWTSRRRMSG